MASDLALERAAQAWCREKTSNRVMDPELAEAFADILDDIWSKPWLGNATNAELIDELKTRIEVHWNLGYRTVGENAVPEAGHVVSPRSGLAQSNEQILRRMRQGERLRWVPSEMVELHDHGDGRVMMIGGDLLDEQSQLNVIDMELDSLIQGTEDDATGVCDYAIM